MFGGHTKVPGIWNTSPPGGRKLRAPPRVRPQSGLVEPLLPLEKLEIQYQNWFVAAAWKSPKTRFELSS